jgi:hypothetical protein
MNAPLRLAAALMVPLLFLTGCGDDEPEKAESSSEPSSEPSTSPTDEATADATADATETTEASTPTEDATDTPTVAESATPVAGDDCTLLPLAAVSEAFEEEVKLVAAGAQTCIFNAAGGEHGLTINLTRIQIDQDEYVEGTRAGCEGRIREVRAGDVAFACVGPIGPQGYVFSDTYSWVLDVAAGDQGRALELAAELLPSVIVE